MQLIIKEPCYSYKTIHSSEGDSVLDNSEKAAIAARAILKAKSLDPTVEHFGGFWLNRKNRIIAGEVLFNGGFNSCSVCVKTMLRQALLNSASAFIAFHNHPSGCADPSRADIQVTRQFREASSAIGIDFLDHIIISSSGSENYYSFQEAGFI